MDLKDSKKPIRIGFIGAGKVGSSLGKYISKKGGCVAGYYSRSLASAEEAATFTGSRAFLSPEQLLTAADVVFVTVPDDVIGDVWRELARETSSLRPLFCHCSGSLPASVFDGAEELGALVCSLHPLLAVPTRRTSWKHLAGASFTFEGGEAAFEALSPVLRLMGNKIGRIEPDKKILYHAACVFFSNLTVGLTGCGVSLLEACGLDSDFSETAWHALFLGNSENIVRKGVAGALTGPVERGDAQTIQNHLEALEAYSVQGKNEDIIYRELSKSLLKIAAKKHPGRDYSNLKF